MELINWVNLTHIKPTPDSATTMKKITLLAGILTTLLFVGCNSTSPITIEEHGAPIAQRIGAYITDPKYISNGDFASIDELTNGFTPSSKGMIALTDMAIYWRDGQGEIATPNPFREIPMSSITGVAPDRNVLQLEINEQIHVLRITEWNRYQENLGQTIKLLDVLLAQNVPALTIEHPYIGKPSNSGRPHPVDNKSFNSKSTNRFTFFGSLERIRTIPTLPNWLNS